MTCHCVLGNIPHTLALGSSVPGLWSEMSAVTWFAAFCTRRPISLSFLAQVFVCKMPSPEETLSSACRPEKSTQFPGSATNVGCAGAVWL